MGTGRGTVVRVVGAALLGGSAAIGLEAALVASARHQSLAVLAPGPARPDEVVGAVLALAAVLVGAWLGATTLVALLAHLPGRAGRALDGWARTWSPRVVRRVAAVLVGASVGGVLAPGAAAGSPPPSPGPGFAVTAPAAPAAPAAPTAPGTLGAAGDRPGAPGEPGFAPSGRTPEPDPAAQSPAFAPTGQSPAPASATTGQSRTSAPTGQSPASAPTGQSPASAPSRRSAPADRSAPGTDAPGPGWVPARPLVRPQASPGLVAGSGRRSASRGVVVLRGDSLWSLVARHLGPGATDAEVAREWPRWYAANRAVIGDDPDLVLPGQVLTVPSLGTVDR